MGGREMIYYVGQNAALLKAAGNTNEFSPTEIAAIDSYIFDKTMHYYALVSLNTRGWSDFLKGLKALRKINKSKLAQRLLSKHLKFLFLKKVGRLKPSKK